MLAIISFDSALPHSGGTDANGGHTNRMTGEYHLHNAKSSPGIEPSNYPSKKTKSIQELSGLSEEDFNAREECKSFTFSEILRQSSTGSIHFRCGQVIMSIDTH